MICAWNDLMKILPAWLRQEVDSQEKDRVNELRLRLNAPVELVSARESRFLRRAVTQEDIDYVVNCASRYSPWAAASISKGYITAPGGHRIGICGEVVCREWTVTGMRQINSLCIRVARDYPGIGTKVMGAQGSVLILGAPGWGKTTLLRDMIRQLSQRDCVAVVDERGELYPPGFPIGRKMDVLVGAPKNQGIEMVLRSMGPNWIAVDEITAPEDTAAILEAFGCGVRLIATAHAASMEDFCRRKVYQPLVHNRIFDTAYVLDADKSFRTERMKS